MAQRLNYMELAPEALAAMQALEHQINTGTGLEANLLGMVRLLASLLNGCEFCIGMHTHELKKENETPERIAGLKEWRDSEAYTHRERTALAWTEIITNIQQSHATDEEYAEVQEHFAGADLVNLTLAITSINSWNRLGIAFRAEKTRVSSKPAAEPKPAGDDGGQVTVDE